MAGRQGLSRDTRGVILTLLRHSAAALTTPQIEARTGFSHAPTVKHLAALEAAGLVGRLTGRPQRWFWRADATEDAAD
jgi:predicted ArsR family transcriptional regulator